MAWHGMAWYNQTIIGIHVLMMVVEDFPILNVAVGLLAHIVYLSLLRSFPVVHVSTPSFLLACCMLHSLS
jgi:hypothetical protein